MLMQLSKVFFYDILNKSVWFKVVKMKNRVR